MKMNIFIRTTGTLNETKSQRRLKRLRAETSPISTHPPRLTVHKPYNSGDIIFSIIT